MDLNFWETKLTQHKQKWQDLLVNKIKGSEKILFCTSIGSHGPVVIHDSLLAAALTARRHQVEILLCDGVLSACEACTYYQSKPEDFIEKGPQGNYCQSCFHQGLEVFQGLELPIYRYGQYLDENDYQNAKSIVKNLEDNELRDYSLNHIKLGEEAYAGTLRFFATGDLISEVYGIKILRRYLEGAILTLKVIDKLFNEVKPTVAVFHHGIYVPQGIIVQVARQHNIRVINWAVGYRKQTFVYSHQDTYHRTMIDEPLELWKDKPLNSQQKKLLTEYLESRKNSSQDWIKFNQNPEENTTLIREKLQLNSKPIILLLTNVTWDAQLYYKNNAFPSLLDWLIYTIKYFEKREDLQLVIRVHPAEIRGTMPTRQPVVPEINKRIPKLPAQVKIVDADSDLSTYTLAEMSNCAIIYGTKTGVELTSRGIPTMVVGEAWIRNKGLTIDVSSDEEYLQQLDKLPLEKRMPQEQVESALQYAYHYYFRRLIPIKYLTYKQPESLKNTQSYNPSIFDRVLSKLKIKSKISSIETKKEQKAQINAPYTITLNDLEELKNGYDQGLDKICEAITTGSDFVFEDATTNKP